jgi:DNA-binding IclR family transcriptional regulator
VAGDRGWVDALNDSKVKSARRVIQVLEFFDEMRSDASVMDVARALDMPQSSTTELLKCLSDLGYLAYDPRTRRYMPTHRVALLGSWIQAPYLGEGRVVQMMEELGEKTRETIILGEPSGIVVRYIYVVPSRQAMRLHVGPGTIRPIARSGLGKLFLTTYPQDRVKDLLKRINADRDPGDPVISYADLEGELQDIRDKGYHLFTNGVNPGAGIIAMLLPQSDGYPPLGIGIGGLAENIVRNAPEFIEAIRQGINRYFG